jgi:hypothetical protein
MAWFLCTLLGMIQKRQCTAFVGQDDRFALKKALCTGHMYPFEAAASFFTRLTSPRSCRDACEKISTTPGFDDDTRHDPGLGMIEHHAEHGMMFKRLRKQSAGICTLA